jgi:hypothetical protein
MDQDLVEQARADALFGDGASHDQDILARSRFDGRAHGCADVAGQEGDIGIVLISGRLVGEYENRPVPRPAEELPG